MPTKEPASWIPWIIIGIMGAMLYQQQAKDDPKPITPTIEQVVRKTQLETAKRYKQAFESAAEKVASDDLKDEETLYKTLKEDLENARRTSSVDLDQLLDSNIPTQFDDGNRGAVSTFLKRVANGFTVR